MPPVRFVPEDRRPAHARAAGWLRRNLFNSPLNVVLTVLVVALAAMIVPPFLRWAVFDASLLGNSRAACNGDGACWTFIRLRLPTFFYGHYPPGQWVARRPGGDPDRGGYPVRTFVAPPRRVVAEFGLGQ